MQMRVLSAISAALAILVPFSAYAGGFQGQAKLATASGAPSSVKVSGVTWTCDGDACVGTAYRDDSLDTFMRECRKVSTALGPLTAYASNGRVMSTGNIAACNRLAEGDRAKQVAAK